jgi:hypothetical protein
VNLPKGDSSVLVSGLSRTTLASVQAISAFRLAAANTIDSVSRMRQPDILGRIEALHAQEAGLDAGVFPDKRPQVNNIGDYSDMGRCGPATNVRL